MDLLQPNPEVVVEVTRGPMVESIHRGHIAVSDTDGRLLAHAGIPEAAVFIRSTAKPLQAIPVITSGAADKLGWGDAEIALCCSSHNGEERQVRKVEQMLNSMALDAGALECGAQKPAYQEAAEHLRQLGIRPTAMHNTCSGKHTGMLALAKHNGIAISHYIIPAHPVQQRMLEAVSMMSGVPADRIVIGTDGCGVPVFGMPLRQLAFAYARLGAPGSLPSAEEKACRHIVGALRKEPYYLAGTDRYDTLLIEATRGRIIGKMGAEGVYAAAIPEQGWGIAVKIEDGSLRALYTVATEVLSQLGLLTHEELGRLARFHHPSVQNRRGETVGEIRPAFRLRT